jgi:hypothetical protein
MAIKETAKTLLVVAVLAVLAAATVFMMVELWQSAYEAGKPEPSLRIIFAEPHDHANPPHPLALLRARRERPCGSRAA